jgi:hypothetical protein
LEKTNFYHQKHLAGENFSDAALFADPFKTKMWHRSFNPHSVPSLEPADLKPMPAQRYGRSESVKDFLDKSKLGKIIN